MLSADARAERDALVLEHITLARTIAWAMVRRSRFEAEDFMQDAMVALVELAGDFDPARGLPFAPYLKMWLPFRLLNRMRRLDRCSERVRRRGRTYAAARATLTHELMRHPTTTEVAEHLGWTVAEIREVRRRTQLRELSFDQLTADDWRRHAGRVAARVDVEATVLESLAIAEIEEAAAQLGARDREVFAYSLDGENQHAIARRLGCAPQRISQRVARIRATITAHIAH